MAPGNKKRAKNRPNAANAQKRPAAAAEASPNDSEGDGADEPAEPMNRAERRLAAKQKSGRQAPTRAPQPGMSAGRGGVSGRGVNQSVTKSKGTNTRRSG
jgi:hypothetical protein